MWTRSYSIITKEASKEQMWKLFSDINNWHNWNNEIKYAKLEGSFKAGNHYIIQPKKGPEVRVELLEIVEYKRCLELGKFPLAKMYYDHVLEETPNGLKIISTITVKGLLGSLWVLLVVKKIADSMPAHINDQVKVASKL
ncbi:MAG: polyketide cyclase [Bacteroidetes bacterium]|nr:polyketide cyclase [Bacteroidota bacterium]